MILDPRGDLGRDGCKCGPVRRVPCSRGVASIGRGTNGDVERDAPEERDAHRARRSLCTALSERIADLAAMGACIARHILDQPDDRHPRLVEQVNGALRVDQRQILRRGNDDRARWLVLGHHRQLHVAGAGRQVDDEDVAFAPNAVDQLAQRLSRHRAAPCNCLTRLYQMAHRQHRHAEFRRHRFQFLVERGRAHPLGRHQARLRGAIDVGIDQAHFRAAPRQCDGKIGSKRRFADAALAAGDGNQLATLSFGGQRNADAGDARHLTQRGFDVGLQQVAVRFVEAGDIEDQAGATVGKTRRCGAAAGSRNGGEGGGKAGFIGHATPIHKAHRNWPTVILMAAPYNEGMTTMRGWPAAVAVWLNEGGPWGGRGSGDGSGSGGSGDGGSGGSGGGGPRNPWNQPPDGGKPRGPRGPTALDELLKRGRAGFGGGKLPVFNAGPMWKYALIAVFALWLALTCVHRIDPQERGVVTMFGKYSRTLEPGVSLTFPAPIERVQTIDVQNIRLIDIPDGAGEKLVLTRDENIIDLDYSIRWSIKDP
ncbi:MAG: hflK, partial [Sphingomonadales bacterium]|nr:hflK [Sphingomonadales bacterium]